LGRGNAWFRSSIDNNRIEFGHPDIPHDVAEAKDRAAILAIHDQAGRDRGKATGYAREILEFYGLGEDCLWITFGDGCMWWAFAKPEVHLLPANGDDRTRCRPVIGTWSNRDASGELLTISKLSTRFTQVSAYRQTLCSVQDPDGIIRRINGLEEPIVAEGRAAEQALHDVAARMIRNLHWRDFEVLCDLIFARSGWQRVAELGGLQKDTDLVLLQSATGERAYVQVKSGSDQAELDHYVQSFESDDSFSQMFYVCHSPRNALAASSRKPVHIWTGPVTAERAVSAGLFRWLLDKAS
jgi:hypothetical protein